MVPLLPWEQGTTFNRISSLLIVFVVVTCMHYFSHLCSYGSVCVFTHDGRSVCSLPGRTTPAISDADTAPLVHAVVGLAFVPVLSRGRQDGYVETPHIVVDLYHYVNVLSIML